MGKNYITREPTKAISQCQCDSVLIKQALTGDNRAFEALYGAHHGQVRSIVSRATGGGEETQDLVQLVFMRAFQGLSGFRGQAALSSWLTRIALNISNSHLRSRGTERRHLEGVNSNILRDWGQSSEAHPEEVVHRKELRSLLRRGMQALPNQQRQAIRLRYLKERSYREIATELQVPLGTVKVWLHRGKHQLKEELKKIRLGL